MRLKIYVDGASWGNPGPAAIGFVIKDEQQKELAKLSQYIGYTTNNQAEYRALIAALKEAAKFRPAEVILYLDSELVERQLAGRYKVKSLSLFPLYNQAVELCKRFANLSFIHISHEENVEAHTLAKEALKKFTREMV